MEPTTAVQVAVNIIWALMLMPLSNEHGAWRGVAPTMLVREHYVVIRYGQRQVNVRLGTANARTPNSLDTLRVGLGPNGWQDIDALRAVDYLTSLDNGPAGNTPELQAHERAGLPLAGGQ